MVDDLLDELHGSTNFTRLDLRFCYNQVKCIHMTHIKWLLELTMDTLNSWQCLLASPIHNHYEATMNIALAPFLRTLS